jgi:hypothetical protein
MADSPSNRAPQTPASQSTRQMLDDLDTLMQRMLALPVQTPDEEGQPPTVVEPGPTRTPAPAAAQFPVHPPSVTVQAPMPAAAHDVFVGRALTGTPLAAVESGSGDGTRPQAPERAPVLRPAQEGLPESTVAAPTYLPVGAEALLPVILHRLGASKAAGCQKAEGSGQKAESTGHNTKGSKPRTAIDPPSASRLLRSGWSMRLLIYLNRSFDRCTPWLGGAGRWLRSEDGRTVLGWTGVAMFAVALVWAVLRFLV